MTVKDFIKQLSKFDQNLDVVFYNDRLDENHWGCELSVDNCNGKDLMIYPTIEEETNKLNDLGFKKEVMSDGITAFTLDSKTFR